MTSALIAVLALCASAFAADVCRPDDLQGAYGFRLAGETTISGKPEPVAGVGRLVFDGAGGLSGVSTVKFAGVLLGNPVTGAYEAQADCSVSWSLQDDSGGWQRFQGTASRGAASVQFRQSDPGGARRGILVKSPESCAAGDFRKRYEFSISGSGLPVPQKGAVEAGGDGTLRWTAAGGAAAPAPGAVHMEDDCFVQLEMSLPETGQTVNFRGVLVDEGKRVLGIGTDPGPAAVELRAR